MTLLLSETELEEYKNLLFEKKILSERLLESVLFSYNKHAKLLRDEMFALKNKNTIYLDDDVEYRLSPEQIEALIDDHYAKITDALDEYDNMDVKKLNIYHKKDVLLNKFLKPCMIHCSENYSRSYYSIPSYNYFMFYRTENASFHRPMEEDDVDEDYVVSGVGQLFVPAKPESEILSLKYCDEIYDFISADSNIVFQASEFTKNMPDYKKLFEENFDGVVKLWIEEYDKQLIKVIESNSYEETFAEGGFCVILPRSQTHSYFMQVKWREQP